MTSFAVKIIEHQQSPMLNICDPELVGKTVSDGKRNLKISQSYYAQKIIDQKEAEHLLRTASIINMAGKETVSLAVKLGVGIKDGVKYIGDTPFLIVYQA